MNRKEYIKRLMTLVSKLPPDKRKSIEDDINSHFDEGLELGESEAALIEKLGPPETLAREYTDIYPEESERDSAKGNGMARRVGVTIGLFFLNLIVTLPCAVVLGSAAIVLATGGIIAFAGGAAIVLSLIYIIVPGWFLIVDYPLVTIMAALCIIPLGLLMINGLILYSRWLANVGRWYVDRMRSAYRLPPIQREQRLPVKRKLMTKTANIILLSAFLLFGCISAGLAFNVIIPDAVAGRPGGNWEEYRLDESFQVSDGASLKIDLSDATVQIKRHSGDNMAVSFEGYRRVLESGEAGLNITDMGGTVRISENSQRTEIHIITFGGMTGANVSGVLTVLIPDVRFDELVADLFSGDILAENIAARDIRLDTSSGTVTCTGLTATGDITVHTFSGDAKLSEIYARDIRLDTSSGKFELADAMAKSFEHGTFSGNFSASGCSFEGMAVISSSSGDIALSGMTADSVSVDTFSSRVSLSAAEAGWVHASTSSGAVTLTGVIADTADIHTFSGRIDVDGAALGSLNSDTSSGDLTASLTEPSDIHAVSFSGYVDITMPEGGGFTLTVDTFSGDLEIGFPITHTGQQNSRGDISGTVGGGEKTVYIETSSGDIILIPHKNTAINSAQNHNKYRQLRLPKDFA